MLDYFYPLGYNSNVHNLKDKIMVKKWTKEDIDILYEMYPDTSNKELSELWGRSIESIRKMAQRYGIRKNIELIGPKCITHDEYVSRSSIEEGITFITKYKNGRTKITLKCKNGHIFSILPKDSITCKECVGKSNNYIMWGDYPNIEEDLIQLLELGYSYKEIAEYYNTTEPAIQRLITSLNLVNTYTKFNKVWAKLEQLCKDLGYTIKDSNCKTIHDKFNYICNNGHYNSTHIKNFIHKDYRCSECSGYHSSQGEKELVDFIRANYSGWIIENDRSILNGKELDIVLPDLGLAFEYNGIYWHSIKHVDKYYHYNKTNDVNSIEYQLIHVFEDTNIDLIKDKILTLLNKNTKIYARKCTVKEINYPKDFLNENHLQGAGSPTKYNYGLYHKDELVSVMTFNTPRFTTKYKYELVRFCSKKGITIVGGASKLFKFANKTSVISYSNRSWSKGKVYETLGFKFSHTTEPNYRYYKGLKSLSRYECQKHLLKSKFPDLYQDELTEEEIMTTAGYLKVYDSGNDVWVY